MFHVILYQPEIPPNTGNVVRLCANTGATLHLVEPLGFSLGEKALRRAGMDYTELVHVRRHRNWEDCRTALGAARLFALTTRGTVSYDQPHYRPGDAFVFGPETRGLPPAMLDAFPAGQLLRLPMRPDCRSMNLANAAAVVVYEAWRQNGFAGGA